MAEARTSSKGLPTLASELWDLVVTYLRQETVDPLKTLGRFVGFGAAGSLLLGIGVVLLSLAGLRAIQIETGERLTGSLTWVPYVIMLVAIAVIALLAIRAIGSTKRRARRTGRIR